jgi:hypothetical protein
LVVPVTSIAIHVTDPRFRVSMCVHDMVDND